MVYMENLLSSFFSDSTFKLLQVLWKESILVEQIVHHATKHFAFARSVRSQKPAKHVNEIVDFALTGVHLLKVCVRFSFDVGGEPVGQPRIPRRVGRIPGVAAARAGRVELARDRLAMEKQRMSTLFSWRARRPSARARARASASASSASRCAISLASSLLVVSIVRQVGGNT